MPGWWVLLGLLISAGAITWATGAVATRIEHRPVLPQRLPQALAAAGWMLVLFVAGLIAARYIERVPRAALGYAAFALIGFSLSLAHAVLLRHRRADRQEPEATRKGTMYYALFLGITLLLILLAAVPIVASDLFRKPYSHAWRTINQVMDRLNYTYNPPGGGEAPSFPLGRTRAMPAWLTLM